MLVKKLFILNYFGFLKLFWFLFWHLLFCTYNHVHDIRHRPGRVRPNTVKMTPVASMDSVYHLRAGEGLVDLVSV